MRFAWLREQDGRPKPTREAIWSVAIFTLYNLVYWSPMISVIFGWVSHATAFIQFTIIIALRTAMNVVRVNMLPPRIGEIFTFRAP